MILRTHQKKLSGVVDGIIEGGGINTMVVDAVPGSGKSLLPLIAASKLIPAGLASKICWICPRTSLQDQGERAFLDPRFRRELNHNLIIRSSTNQENPSRGTAGFTTTYQALAVDISKTALRDFERHRYILVLDEFHHLAEGGEWTAPIRELYERAKYRLLMTGTLSRGDQQKIAFTPYCPKPAYNISGKEQSFIPDFASAKNTALISYTRSDALAEQAIIPLEFHFADGLCKWQKVSGKEVEAKLSTSRADANQALFTALKTEYAEEMLLAGVAHWKDHYYGRPANCIGKPSLLVVAANIETAKQYTAILRRKGLQAEIATSDDTPDAIKHIKALKAGKLKILVSVAMASEGLDVPSISHIICLTNVRTPEWLIQMCGRAVRIDPQAGPYETQKGYIFAPADRMFTELAAKIKADQCESVAKAKAEKESRGEFTLDGGSARPGITPLSSRMLDAQRQHIFHYEDTAAPIQTQRELETELRKQIEAQVSAFCRMYNCKAATVNTEIKRQFGKGRAEMTVEELEKLTRWVNQKYVVPERKPIASHVLAERWGR